LKAFFLTNTLGFAGDLNNIRTLCADRGIILIEDNCEALGTELPTGKTGNFGVASTFSFFVAHHMSTIEGGMICTADEELAEMLRMVRANGWDRNLNAVQQAKWRKRFKIQNEFEAKYAFYDLAYNMRPTEITGFLGLTQLPYLEESNSIRAKNHAKLEVLSKGNRDLITIETGHIKKLAPFAFPVVCKSPQLREKYLSQFSGAGIEIRPMIAGNMQRQPFYNKYAKRTYDLPCTEFLHHSSFYCGNYPELSDADLETISSCLLNY
jgi:CDP-6-deoxy-D-xylo-4-hexulose-3-dehydrase